MSEAAFQEALASSVEDVLEKMFFIQVLAQPPDPSAVPGDDITARLTFDGDPSGGLRLDLSRAVARSIAADFLAEDEGSLTDEQVDEVVCELANMICGSMLSRVESETTFRLSSPRIVAGDEDGPLPNAVGYDMEIGQGLLRVRVYTETGWESTAKVKSGC